MKRTSCQFSFRHRRCVRLENNAIFTLCYQLYFNVFVHVEVNKSSFWDQKWKFWKTDEKPKIRVQWAQSSSLFCFAVHWPFIISLRRLLDYDGPWPSDTWYADVAWATHTHEMNNLVLLVGWNNFDLQFLIDWLSFPPPVAGMIVLIWPHSSHLYFCVAHDMLPIICFPSYGWLEGKLLNWVVVVVLWEIIDKWICQTLKTIIFLPLNLPMKITFARDAHVLLIKWFTFYYRYRWLVIHVLIERFTFH